MTLARYEIFRSIVETGGFFKAANVLGLTQSAVSHAISSLESEFGFTLLTRGRSGVKLTNNGEKMLLHVHRILNSYEQMMQEAAEIEGVKTGIVRIGTFPSVSINWLPKIIKEFKQQYPHIEVKLLEGDYDDINKWILNGSVDFGFLSLPADNIFDTIPLKKDRILCVMSNQHPLSNQKTITFEQLKEAQLIMPKTNIDKDVRDILKENNITLSIGYEMEEDQAIIAMVQNNLGISILPELILYRLPEDIRIRSLEKEYYRTIGMAVQSLEKAAPATRVFMETVQEWIEENYV
ncbi:LysR family transcriptional regulator [Oceanobacillus sojae]|uniref:LysR family transcriptional regulator n=1 Tax=Oceanobacillus sojae TaxID=582851 RepID=A0A511ZNQ7_9BACI|nr:LysR family transcriptional regulator [Oceanobacillus sojae]GEN89090.1 LysR family transcriptional regulator [Oceanobacillus sojae]